MADTLQKRRQSVRRQFLKRLLVTSAIGLQPAMVLAATDPLFQDRPEDLTGPLSQFTDELSTRANSMGKPGRYPQELFERFQAGDQHARLELYQLSEHGDEYARTIIGWMFDNGVGAVRDSAKAADLFLLASLAIPLAHYNLGVLLLQGRGVAQNSDKAMEHFGQSKRIAPAYVQLSYYAITHEKGNAALHFAQKAARLRDPAGMYLYARLLLEKGEEKKGAQLMNRAARANYPDAMTAMIVLYERGVGITLDRGMSTGWWMIDKVLNHGQTIDSCEKAIDQFNLSGTDRAKAIRYARKWLLNRTPMEPFDYAKTLNFDDVRRF